LEPSFFHAGGQTDVTKLIVTVRNFANAPKNGSSYKRISIQNEI